MTARATPFALPLLHPLRIGGVDVSARFGVVVEVGESAEALERAPLAARGIDDLLGIAEVAWLPQAGVPDWSDAAALRIGVETAQLDRAARQADRPLAALLGGVRRTRIRLNALLTARAPRACAAQAVALVAAGFGCLKLKLDGADVAGNCRRLTAVRAAIGPDIALRADANAAWTVAEAVAALHRLAVFDLEYVEQPVAGIAALAAVRRAVPMRIAADEAITGAGALAEIIAAGAADVIVLKPSLLGLRDSIALAARVHAAGLDVVVTSVLDTTLGIAAAAHVAAAVEGPLLACGLATADLLAGDLAATPLPIERGELLLPQGAGLGVDLDREALDRWRMATSFNPLTSASAARVASPTSSLNVAFATSGHAARVSLLAQRARTHGQRLALQRDTIALTFAALAEQAAAASARLAAAGIGTGDRVALLIADRLAFAVWLHGVTQLGAVAVPLGVRAPAAEVARHLAACRCRALVADTETAAIAAALPAALCGARFDAADLTTAALSPPAPPGLNAPHSVVFTSGSSGTPKAVLLTHGNHLWSAIGSAVALGVRDDDRWLACLPPHHVGGLSILMRSVVSAVPVILHQRFDPLEVNRAFDDDGVTLVSLVANMLQRVLDARGARPLPPALRCVLLGGGPAPQALLDECARRGVPLALTYGMTETASQLVTNGRPLLGAALRIMRDGAPVESGQVGMIEVCGPMLSPGYWQGGALIATGDWLRTNDLGYCDTEGGLHIVGRTDDVLISGGENVHPHEVERALEAHPAVAEACVFGLPDAVWGETVAACVRARPGAVIDAAALATYARGALAAFKVPRHIAVVADFPRTAAGKVRRRAVRDAALAAP
ncbi:MAG: AMP-binding protein [bacterium]